MWLSSGRTNAEMVEKLKNYGVIKSPAVVGGFQSVDRGLYVPVELNGSVRQSKHTLATHSHATHTHATHTRNTHTQHTHTRARLLCLRA